jgi:hypothetical protein
VVYAPTLDAGRLAARFDVLIFPDGGIPSGAGAGPGGGDEAAFFGGPVDTAAIPAEYRSRVGRVTVDKTVPQLREFLNAGGTILTIGSSTSLARHLGLPFTNHLVEDGKPLPNEKFYVPGSVLQVRVDNTRPIAYGLSDRVDVFFDESPVLRLAPDASPDQARPVAWYETDHPLRSGWAWGQRYLKDGLAAAEVTVGRGKVYLFGPEILFRGQPHGTFKFLFNGIQLARAGGGNARVPTASGGSR